MADHNELGKAGEDMAAAELIKKGYKILARNWKYLKEELDIIARIGNDIVFVEVKTRTGLIEEDPGLLVSKKKQKHIVEAADAWLKENEINEEARFDLIVIQAGNKETSLQHIEHAFYPLIG